MRRCTCWIGAYASTCACSTRRRCTLTGSRRPRCGRADRRGAGGQRFCIDAIFGIGARPGLEGKAAEWAELDRRAATVHRGGRRAFRHRRRRGDVAVVVRRRPTRRSRSAPTRTRCSPPLRRRRPANGTAIAELVDIGLGPISARLRWRPSRPDDGHLLVDVFAWLGESDDPEVLPRCRRHRRRFRAVRRAPPTSASPALRPGWPGWSASSALRRCRARRRPGARGRRSRRDACRPGSSVRAAATMSAA